MSDVSDLVANNSPKPAGMLPDEGRNYEHKHCLAFAKWTVPILWVALFVEDDLKDFETVESTCIAPVTSLRKARENWSRRLPRIRETFPHDLPVFEKWEIAINKLKARYIKIDITELWLMSLGIEEDEFAANLRGGTRWFDTGDESDFEHLQGLLWRKGAYDPTKKAFTQDDDVPFMYYGHPLRLPTLGE